MVNIMFSKTAESGIYTYDIENSEEASRSPGCSKAWVLVLRPSYAVSRGMFSRPEHRGYTNNIQEAGRFSEAEALEYAGMHPHKYVAIELAKP